jgi:hypothetical protein
MPSARTRRVSGHDWAPTESPSDDCHLGRRRRLDARACPTFGSSRSVIGICGTRARTTSGNSYSVHVSPTGQTSSPIELSPRSFRACGSETIVLRRHLICSPPFTFLDSHRLTSSSMRRAGGSHDIPVHVSQVLEDRSDTLQMLRGADDAGESRRRNLLALDVAAPARRRGVIRTLAVTGVFVVAASVGLPSGAPAQTPAQGQAIGILFLLGASRTGVPTSVKTPEQKPKPGIETLHEPGGRFAVVKQKPLSVKDRPVPARMGGSTADNAARPSAPLHGTVLRVTSDQNTGRKLDRPVELTGGTHAKPN